MNYCTQTFSFALDTEKLSKDQLQKLDQITMQIENEIRSVAVDIVASHSELHGLFPGSEINYVIATDERMDVHCVKCLIGNRLEKIIPGKLEKPNG